MPFSFPLPLRGATATFGLLVASLLAGCSSPSDGDPSPGPALPEPEEDPWDGGGRLRILEIHADLNYEYDVMCVSGGGPMLPREEDGPLVAPGTDHLELTVQADATFTGLQIGHVVDGDPAADERGQEGITWLPPVRGGQQVFTVPVGDDAIERDGPLWAFYHRMQPGADVADCYTGGGTGQWSVLVDAVRGAAADVQAAGPA